MEEPTTDALDLREYLAVLARRKWIVVITLVLVVASAVGVTLAQTPIYTASTRLLVEPTGNVTQDSFLAQLFYGQRELETQKELVTSIPVASLVVEDLGLAASPESLLGKVSVAILRDTQIMDITTTSADPAFAAELAESFASSYISFRQSEALNRAMDTARALADIETDTRARLDEIDAELQRTFGSEAEALQRERDLLLNDLAGLGAQRQSLQSLESIATGGGRIILPARVPTTPSSPRLPRTLVLSIVLGLGLGVALAFARDYLDDAIRSEEQAIRTVGRPVLGYVPRWTNAVAGDRRLVSVVEPASPTAEAYRTLRTNIRFLSVDKPVKSLVVTSALPDEGKTITAANLAVSMARSGTRVLLVGGDLRRPTLNKSFGVAQSPGLSDVLAGDAELLSVICDVGVANLRVVTSGRTPPNPAELLGSPAMTRLMAELEQLADVVIYDAPPVLAVADPLELAPKASATLLVVDLGTTGRHALKSATTRLNGVGAQLAGVVLNNLSASDGYYAYQYYAEEPVKPAKSRRDKVSGRGA